MSTVIITNCTNRKRLGGLAPLELCTSHNQSLTATTATWVQQVKARTATRPAESLYTGRSVQDAKWAAQKLDAKLMFASTGLGLIDGEHPCPPYNLTVSTAPDSIRPWLGKMGLRSSDWWDAINSHWHRPNPIAALAGRTDIKHILVALSANYIDLVANDLMQIAATDRCKMRFFTSRPGVASLPEQFHPLAMPYDGRLESSQLAGTRADFPQRAMRHFIELIEHPTDSPSADYQAVANAMSALTSMATVKRRRVSDAEVKMLLNEAWDAHKGSSSRLLRYLRDDALVACEQSRFRGLWLELQERTRRSKA
ncbi:hypothetical protein ACEPXJ_25395 [Pseudomonas aeruginosa]|uniref:hypothetical protein n=1 Tax=Pseudomonas aeruginosa TaxID=287 RepID=UPI000FEE6865|nr:hypothetical protein [Pseudomonas aeruginosa]RWX94763.1 hypothetical protein EQH71_29125 [Pseudomonas aeruginosa]HBN8247402.1 hypothetical protein [Pseudomonas aeruginosa]HBN8402455.1 hypothetical protein [Pseudomonas aeruginosa]HCF3332967.1 hypothetical protein [Pseudomonas aeruginosa]HEB0638733.1 hypothetical protein [Pseudomonas aeruginosa]